MRVIALIVRAGLVVAASAFLSLVVDGAPRPATAAEPGVVAIEGTRHVRPRSRP